MNQLSEPEKRLWNRFTQDQKDLALNYCVDRIDQLMVCVISVFDKELSE